MSELTPLVQTWSIDKPVLYRGGAYSRGRLRAGPICQPGENGSWHHGFCWSRANQLRAKIAVGRSKPHGVSVVDAEVAASLPASESFRLIPDIGATMARQLEALSITRLGHPQFLSNPTRCGSLIATCPQWRN